MCVMANEMWLSVRKAHTPSTTTVSNTNRFIGEGFATCETERRELHFSWLERSVSSTVRSCSPMRSFTSSRKRSSTSQYRS